MSSRPSARYNDPGYFYSPAKLIRIFAILSAIMTLGIFAMIYVDWKRPWKDDQNAERKWVKIDLDFKILLSPEAKERNFIVFGQFLDFFYKPPPESEIINNYCSKLMSTSIYVRYNYSNDSMELIYEYIDSSFLDQLIDYIPQDANGNPIPEYE